MTSLPEARRAQAATQEVFALAEGPWWDPVEERLLWVDILEGRVLEGRLADGIIQIQREWLFPHMVGAVAVTTTGGLLVAGQERLVLIGNDGRHVAGPTLLEPGAGRRLNDGSPDPEGRYLVGSLTIGGPTTFAERLFAVHPHGAVSTIDEDLSLSNGLAWSSDGSTLYSADTLRGVVWQRDYDPASGRCGERSAFLQIEDGLPDGIAIDAEDHLWVAHWGIGEVRRYDLAGHVVDRICVPAPHTSAVAFAGRDLRTLVITTASAELAPGVRESSPHSGRLFVAPCDVPGRQTPPANVAWGRGSGDRESLTTCSPVGADKSSKG